jgi:formate-dependent nitrite reductase membrane component NrfD
MNEQEAKDLEQLAAKVMQKTTLETPSFQFTDKVMAAINVQEQAAAVRNRPLIPKYIWVAIAAVVIGFTAYIWFLVQPAPLDLPVLSFDFIKSNSISKEVAAFTPSKITVYAVLLLALMLCVQIPVLKRYFDDRV